MSRGCNVFVERQVCLEIAVCFISFAVGLFLAFPSVLNPAILAPDADVKVTDDQASWIATCLGIGGIMGYTFMPTIFDIFGRKTANITINIFIIIGSLIMYAADDVYTLAFARILQGPTLGGTVLSCITICECSSPKRRGYFMVLHKVSIGLGSLTCRSLGFIFNWRQIALVAALGSFISIIIFGVSAESPSFLAMRGKFDKCAEAFEWYRGDSLNAKKELKELIVAQKEHLRIKEREKNISVLKKTKDMLMTKEFQKAFYIVSLAHLCVDSCGRYFVLSYITGILIDLTNDTTLSMYIAVGTDCMLILALGISSVLVKHFRRRTLLFRLGFCSAFLMFMISLSVILRSKLNLFQDMKWLTPGMILLHTFVTNLGLVPIAYSLMGEVFTLDHRGLGSFMTGLVFLFFFNVVLKLTPIMIEKTGVEGTYSIYGTFLCIFLTLMRIILPETKDKTLQQIEDEIKGLVRNDSDIELQKLSKDNNG